MFDITFIIIVVIIVALSQIATGIGFWKWAKFFTPSNPPVVLDKDGNEIVPVQKITNYGRNVALILSVGFVFFGLFNLFITALTIYLISTTGVDHVISYKLMEDGTFQPQGIDVIGYIRIISGVPFNLFFCFVIIYAAWRMGKASVEIKERLVRDHDELLKFNRQVNVTIAQADRFLNKTRANSS